MPKTNTKSKPSIGGEASILTNSAFELVNWASLSSSQISANVLAIQTTRHPTVCKLETPSSKPHVTQVDRQYLQAKKSSYDSFNLGLHVGDATDNVTHNRNQLKDFISQKLLEQPVSSNALAQPVDIQWLEQVHGDHVVEVSAVSTPAIIADASITRHKNIALAIMTADCLPILLSDVKGEEVAAIHGGWRPLAANIIKKTIEKMHSDPANIVAWLGPCIGKEAFEVGVEVKDAFIQQDNIYSAAFIKYKNDKYLANLHKIAELQLHSLGVRVISNLNECTFQRTDKYYSYRKDHVTGRMASVICRR
jgi:YfiH family protein